MVTLWSLIYSNLNTIVIILFLYNEINISKCDLHNGTLRIIENAFNISLTHIGTGIQHMADESECYKQTLICQSQDTIQILDTNAQRTKLKLKRKLEISETKDSDYSSLVLTNTRFGAGEMGKPVVLPSKLNVTEWELVREGWRKYNFNQFVSDMISVNRSVPEARVDWCMEPGRILNKLPQADVILCFHNDAFKTFLRTIHSILNRSPQKLLNKIIVVDDFSDIKYYNAMKIYWIKETRVEIVRTKKRDGLIRARLFGFSFATAPVVIFMNPYNECNEGWLEPLLDRIARNSKAVVFPAMDIVNADTMEYFVRDLRQMYVGVFDWNLDFDWKYPSELERMKHEHLAEPIWSPVMSNEVFAISKKYFDYLGKYDSGFSYSNVENLELSFKTWMCGGSVELVPCSHVGHIPRQINAKKYENIKKYLRINAVRLAEVWMDEYAKFFYKQTEKFDGDVDVSERKALRNSLQCKSFRWYLKTVYPQMIVPKETISFGEIRNMDFGGRLCLDSINSKNVAIWECHGNAGNQYWMYTEFGEIRDDFENCLDFSGVLTLYGCHGGKGNQWWNYDLETGHIRHVVHTMQCLTININPPKIDLILATCDLNSYGQRWTLENLNRAKLEETRTGKHAIGNDLQQ